MNVPAITRPYPVDDPKSELRVGFRNFLRKEDEFMVHVAILSTPATDQVRQQFAQNIAQKFGQNAQPKWSAPKGEPKRWVLDAVDAPGDQLAKDAPPATVRYALVELSPQSTALVT